MTSPPPLPDVGCASLTVTTPPTDTASAAMPTSTGAETEALEERAAAAGVLDRAALAARGRRLGAEHRQPGGRLVLERRGLVDGLEGVEDPLDGDGVELAVELADRLADGLGSRLGTGSRTGSVERLPADGPRAGRCGRGSRRTPAAGATGAGRGVPRAPGRAPRPGDDRRTTTPPRREDGRSRRGRRPADALQPWLSRRPGSRSLPQGDEAQLDDQARVRVPPGRRQEQARLTLADALGRPKSVSTHFVERGVRSIVTLRPCPRRPFVSCTAETSRAGRGHGVTQVSKWW